MWEVLYWLEEEYIKYFWLVWWRFCVVFYINYIVFGLFVVVYEVD